MSDQKVVLITGSARGIGFAHAERFAAAGYRVVLTDLEEENVKAAASKIGRGIVGWNGGDAVGWRMDVRHEASVAETFARVKSDLGRLDVLVNNAGISKAAPLPEVSDEEWTNMLEVHLGGSFRCAKFAYPLLVETKGSIVNTSSGAGVLSFGNRASYAAAKAGILAFTRDIAVDFAKDGIRVNAIIPGYFMTDIVRPNIEAGYTNMEKVYQAIPMGRLGEVSELSDAVFFMADTATYMTGQSITIDGGLLIRGGF